MLGHHQTPFYLCMYKEVPVRSHIGSQACSATFESLIQWTFRSSFLRRSISLQPRSHLSRQRSAEDQVLSLSLFSHLAWVDAVLQQR